MYASDLFASPAQGLFVYLLGSGILLLVLWTMRKGLLSQTGEREVRLISRGQRETGFGVVWGLFSLWGDPKPGFWGYVTIGLLCGILAGALTAHRSIVRWQSELDRDEHLRPVTRSGWQSWQAVVIVGLAIATSLPASWLSGLTANFWVGIWEAMAGFFLAGGVHIWLWARGKERQGYRPLVLPFRRNP